MTTLLHALPWIIGGIGVWCVVMGVLHDIFVLLSEHGKKYDRDLLRLLMDGHVLITCGVVLLLCVAGLKTGEHSAYFIAMTCCASLLVYCAMIWKFLKSVVTSLLSIFGLILLFAGFFSNI